MKKLILLLICGLRLSGVAQSRFEPQILILSPKNVSYDPSLKVEVDKTNDSLKKMAAMAQTEMVSEDTIGNEAENFKLIKQSAVTFLPHINLFNEVSVLTQTYLVYHFFEKFPNCLILVKYDDSERTLVDLKKIANEQHIAYVVNFPSILFYKQNGITWCKLHMQLYDLASNTLMVDNYYTGDWNSPGFEFTCNPGTMGCSINNSLAKALPDVLYKVAENNPTLIREKQVALLRSETITSIIYPEVYDTTLIKQVIPAINTNIRLNELYQCFYNADQTQFVGFFIRQIDKKEVGSFMDSKGDRNIKVITQKDINDTGYFKQTMQTYAYIVEGVKYKDKWFYQKDNVTYFDAPNLTEGKIEYLNNLQQWDFFEKNSAKSSENFWTGDLFEVIKDLRKNPDWEKHKDLYETEERENRDYIGIYKLVADQLKQVAATADSTFKDYEFNNVLLPFYEQQVNLKLNHFRKITKNDGYYCLIYPKDKQILINPVEVTDENGVNQVRYFVLIPETKGIYEWTLVKPNILKTEEYSDNPINNTIGALTKWNLSYKTLDDDSFWQNNVLAKDGTVYKYLKKLQ
jgi:hypothetical protein